MIRFKNKHLVGYDEYVGNRLKTNPEFLRHYLEACMDDANDPELGEDEQVTALILAIRGIVESYDGIDGFLHETNASVNRETLSRILADPAPKQGPSAITLLEVFNAAGYSLSLKGRAP